MIALRNAPLDPPIALQGTRYAFDEVMRKHGGHRPTERAMTRDAADVWHFLYSRGICADEVCRAVGAFLARLTRGRPWSP
jgi:hypothetical protein